MNRKDILEQITKARKRKVKIGFTSGTFDILHTGHIDYLEKAKSQCDLLIVGVNTDRSVKQYKDPLRPINQENDRLRLVKALSPVDYAYLFEEENNAENINILKPDIYFKGGDYKEDNLTSAKIVQRYGGGVKIIPFLEGYSTSTIIKRIERQAYCVPPEEIIYQPAPALFLDRDGTIVEEVFYLHEPQKIKFIPGVFEVLKLYKQKGYRLVIVTNQPGIGMGYFTREDFFAVNAEILKEAAKHGALFDKIYYCGHSKSDRCNCRKPNTGMLERAVKELNIIPKKSYLIGDMTSDILTGKNFGCKTVLVGSGKGGKDGLYEVEPDFRVGSLGEFKEGLS